MATGSTEKVTVADPADFETAISATGLGRFNLLLVLIIFPSGWANTFESTTMSYVFPAAQCDLDLTLEDKGVLNAITYSGMISSAIMWGFLFDTLGRKKLMMVGYFLDFLCAFINALSQSKTMLLASKFFGGFVLNGPYVALSTYISEFHGTKMRGRMQLLIAIALATGVMILPAMALTVLSKNIYFTIGALEFHSWNVYLLITSLPALIASIIFAFMPESPKFLMAVGKNEKALKLFEKIYAMNSRKPKESFPIKELVDEIKLKNKDLNQHGGQVTAGRGQMKALQEGWQQIKPLFFPPHLSHILLVCLIQTLFTMNVNTLRLWLPQIFQALNDYQYYNNVTSVDLCKSLDMIRPSNTTEKCVFNMDNSSVYVNNMIVNITVMLFMIFASTLINTVGKKKLLFICGTLAGGGAFAIYFSTNTQFAVAFSSLFLGLAGVAANIVVVVTVDLFPTTLRAMALSIGLMCGRIGSLIGNLLFPLLIQTGCAPPFFTLGSLLIACAFFSLLLPNTDLKALE